MPNDIAPAWDDPIRQKMRELRRVALGTEPQEVAAMPADTAPAWDGVPLNAEEDGWHWIAGAEHPAAIVWHANTQNWVLGALGLPPAMFMTATYLGPCITPDEVQAREAAVWAAGAAAMREAAAADVDCGCVHRDVVVARYESQGHKRASYLCSQGDACCALAAISISALPIPPMPGTTKGSAGDE